MEKLKESLGKVKSLKIPPDVLVNHFAKLNARDPEVDPVNKDRCQSIDAKLNDLMVTQTNLCPYMDKDFSLEEILAGIKSLRKGKASGLDAISNDIIHCVAGSRFPGTKSHF